MRQACCAPEKFPATGNPEDDFGLICKALGHPARVRIVRKLIEKGTCISGDLASEFDLAPSTVSEHLRILKEATLVQGSIDGPKRCYCVNPATLEYWRGLMRDLGI